MSEIQYTPQQINKMAALAKQAIEMQSDIAVVISVFSGALQAFGLNEMKMSEGASIQSLLPGIITKLTVEMGSGSFNSQALANVQEVMPIINKYKHLSDGK